MPDEDPPPPGDDKKFSQAEVDRMITERLRRAKPDDYEDLKAAAKKLAELEAANQSDLDKHKARADEAERKLSQASAENLRLQVAAEKGIKAKYLSGATREELEASAKDYLDDHPNPTAGGGSTGNGEPRKPAPAKPSENLSGGGEPNTEPEPDIAAIVAKVPRL